MKTMTRLVLISFITFSSMTAIPGFAQESQEKMTREEFDQVAIREKERKDNEIKAAKEHDADQISDLRQDRAETKATASEAKRVERDANDAARESRSAYRTERKAQKARKNADRQAKKADKARDKSNRND